MMVTGTGMELVIAGVVQWGMVGVQDCDSTTSERARDSGPEVMVVMVIEMTVVMMVMMMMVMIMMMGELESEMGR